MDLVKYCKIFRNIILFYKSKTMLFLHGNCHANAIHHFILVLSYIS